MFIVVVLNLLKDGIYSLLVTIQNLRLLLLSHMDADLIQFASDYKVAYMTVFQLLIRAEGVLLTLNLTV